MDRLEFAYTTESNLPGGLDEEDCAGELYFTEQVVHCQVTLTVEDVQILGIYDPWPQGNPTLAANPVYATFTVLNETQKTTLILSLIHI